MVKSKHIYFQYHVPATKDTIYMCRVFAMNLPKKHHMIKVSAINILTDYINIRTDKKKIGVLQKLSITQEISSE